MRTNKYLYFSGSTQDGVYPHHVQTDFAHVICCVIPCVSPFTPYGLAPFTGIGDGTMDLAILSNVTRCANLRFMRKVAMHGGKSVLKMSNMLNVFRVSQWMFTPAALLTTNINGKESDNANQGSWNLDGGNYCCCCNFSIFYYIFLIIFVYLFFNFLLIALFLKIIYNCFLEILPQPRDTALQFRFSLD